MYELILNINQSSRTKPQFCLLLKPHCSLFPEGGAVCKIPYCPLYCTDTDLRAGRQKQWVGGLPTPQWPQNEPVLLPISGAIGLGGRVLPGPRPARGECDWAH